MKKLSTYIVLFISILMLTVSCVIEDTVPNTPDSKGGDDIVLDVSILSGPESTKASDPNVLNASEYAVERVRLYVFNNIGTAASPNYKFEKTELFTGNNILEKTEAGCKVKIVVKEGLSKKIIVILNEPTRLTATLNKCTKLDEIKSIQYDFISDYAPKVTSASLGYSNGIFSIFGNTAPAYTLPFYGESKEFTLVKTVAPKTITINVKRCVARVDVYFRKASDIYANVTTNTNTTFSVSNTSRKGTIGNKNNSLVVASLTANNLTSNFVITATAQRVCHFYMAPIGTNIVSPTMTINNIFYSDYSYYRDFTVSNFINSAIKENYIYKIYCDIKSIGEINVSNITISDWSDVTVDGNIHGSEIIFLDGKTVFYIQQAVKSNITVPVISRGDLSMSRFTCRRNKVYEYYKYSNSTYTKLSETTSLGVIDDGPIPLEKLPVWVSGGISLKYSKTYNGLRYYNLSVTKQGNHITYGEYEAVTSSTTPKPPAGATHRRLRIEEKGVYVYLKCDVTEKVAYIYIR